VKTAEFKKELVGVAQDTLEKLRARSWERAKSDLLEIAGAFDETLKELRPAKAFSLLFNTETRINPDVGLDFPEEITVFVKLGAGQTSKVASSVNGSVFVDRFYLRKDGHYPVICYYPKDQVIPIGDKEGLQQRFLLHLATLHSPVIQLLKESA